jgi:hypothetical protein
MNSGKALSGSCEDLAACTGLTLEYDMEAELQVD